MKAILRLGAAFAAASLLPACATITRGTKEMYRITSLPPEADVALSTGQTCTTPCKLKLKRKQDFTARITKAGYEPVEAKVDAKMKGGGVAGAAGNVIFGGIIGGVVDGTNGSLMDLTPNPLQVTLRPTGAAHAEAAPAGAPAPGAPAGSQN